VLVETVRHGLVVYDQDRNRMYKLEPVGGPGLAHSDGRKGVAEMAALLQRELDFTADEVVVRLKTTSPGPGLAWLALNQLERAAFE
jgi:hypothetical protein